MPEAVWRVVRRWPDVWGRNAARQNTVCRKCLIDFVYETFAMYIIMLAHLNRFCLPENVKYLH